jgi:hypothetical protein
MKRVHIFWLNTCRGTNEIPFLGFGASPRYLYFSFVCPKEKVAKEKGTPSGSANDLRRLRCF